MALQDPIGEMQKRAMDGWLEAIAERKYLEWFFNKADFGEVSDDVRQIMEEQYTKETGRIIPLTFKVNQEDL